MSKLNFLVVEDDPNLGQILNEYLGLKGYSTTLCTDGEQALDQFHKNQFDLCILDVMMPKKDGFSLAQDIRKVNTEVPIVFLTAKSMKEDAIKGLKIGADDYVTKPFSMEELLLRIEAILRRSNSNDSHSDQECFALGKYAFDYLNRTLKSNNSDQKLTTKEADLLRLLCLNQNKTLERSTALKMIWKDDSYFNARSMDVYIAKLRKYIKADEALKILTIHGTGFKLVNVE